MEDPCGAKLEELQKDREAVHHRAVDSTTTVRSSAAPAKCRTRVDRLARCLLACCQFAHSLSARSLPARSQLARSPPACQLPLRPLPARALRDSAGSLHLGSQHQAAHSLAARSQAARTLAPRSRAARSGKCHQRQLQVQVMTTMRGAETESAGLFSGGRMDGWLLAARLLAPNRCKENFRRTQRDVCCTRPHHQPWRVCPLLHSSISMSIGRERRERRKLGPHTFGIRHEEHADCPTQATLRASQQTRTSYPRNQFPKSTDQSQHKDMPGLLISPCSGERPGQRQPNASCCHLVPK